MTCSEILVCILYPVLQKHTLWKVSYFGNYTYSMLISVKYF